MTQDAAPPLDGGRYRLVDVLGAGGMASVYRAWDQRLEAWRAVKVLAPQLTGRSSIRTRFENEARTMARLHHRNIVTVHDVGTDGDRVYMVMELVEGGSLVDWVDAHGPMPARLAIDVMSDVLVALQVAHDNGVIHRDIKPHNILLSAGGTPKVSDFGIARLTDTDHSLTGTGALMGTWSYMAPEQRTSARRVDARADVYAASATLYALVTAREPYDLYTSELHDEMFAEVPEDVAAIIQGGCRYKPEDRYESAVAMRDALATLQGEYTAVPEGTPPLVSEADTGGASAPPPPPLADTTLAPASTGSESTFHMTLAPPDGGSAAGEQAQGGLQEVVPGPTRVPAPVESTPLPEQGTLSEEGVGLGADAPSVVSEGGRGDDEGRGRGVVWALGVVGVLVLGVGAVALGAGGLWFAGVLGGDAAEVTSGVAVEQPDAAPTGSEAGDTAAAPGSDAGSPAGDARSPGSGAGTPGSGGAGPAPGPSTAAEPASSGAPPTDGEPAGSDAGSPGSDAASPGSDVASPGSDAGAPGSDAEPAAATGRLGVNSIPYYSQVYVDGEHVGRTPWTGHLEAGEHQVVLQGSKGGRGDLTVDVPADERRVVCWDFDEGARCRR